MNEEFNYLFKEISDTETHLFDVAEEIDAQAKNDTEAKTTVCYSS
jgi:hypothetical protein